MNTRVAFTLIGGKNWTGGYNYLLNLLRVVQSEALGQITPVLFSGTDVPEDELKPFADIPGCEVVQDPAFDDSKRSGLMLKGLLLGKDPAADRVMQSNRIEVVFEAAVFLGWRLSTPAIAWMPDFQHHFLPGLFTRQAWWKRELGFRAQIAAGRTVMVSSEDSLRSCQKYYPSVGSRVHAVRFAVRPPEPMPAEQARSVADRYGLPQNYFFMPNQFWAHKNHLLVIEALEILRDRGAPVTVVATGKQLDPRNLDHVPALQATVKKAGLEQQLLMPGMIPYEDLMPLMRASTALLNPSLFEGWSTTVEEARSAGVPMILSDLEVHKEQAAGQAIFFDRYSSSSLAECLSTFESPPASILIEMQKAAAEVALARVGRFAHEFVHLVHIAARQHPRR